MYIAGAMHFNTLENIDEQELLDVFNASFKGYYVPLQLTQQQLSDMLYVDRIDLSLSAGAFDQGRLTGFLLHGFGPFQGVTTLYNAGTGILPAYRRRGVVRELYDFLTPLILQHRVDQCLLEVIDENAAGIGAYRSSGFEVSRTLDCYKGTIRPALENPGFEMAPLNDRRPSVLSAFGDTVPTWQNALETIDRMGEKVHAVGCLHQGKLIGYAFFQPGPGVIHQFGIHPEFRKMGAGSTLFKHIASATGKPVVLLNVDRANKRLSGFLHAVGLTPYITQLEMVRKFGH